MICNNVILVAKVELSFYSFFIFIFFDLFYLGTRVRVSVTSHDTIMVTLSHDHVL